MFKRDVSIIGHGNRLSYTVDNKGNKIHNHEIVQSWKMFYSEKVKRTNDEIGLRLPQFGALSAIRAHWATSNSPATIVLPTGTGKTETMFAKIFQLCNQVFPSPK